MAGMYRMEDLLNLLRSEGAEELRLTPGTPPALVTQGKSRPLDTSNLTPGESDILLNSISNDEQRKELEACGDIQFIFTQNSTRFAVTATHSGGTINIRIRNLGR
jgi:Tfp pilus assembly ATPase PilU